MHFHSVEDEVVDVEEYGVSDGSDQGMCVHVLHSNCPSTIGLIPEDR